MSVVDWAQYPEPYRSIGLRWVEELKIIWSYAKLGAMAGCSAQTVWKIERGHFPNSKFIDKIRECLSIKSDA